MSAAARVADVVVLFGLLFAGCDRPLQLGERCGLCLEAGCTRTHDCADGLECSRLPDDPCEWPGGARICTVGCASDDDCVELGADARCYSDACGNVLHCVP